MTIDKERMAAIGKAWREANKERKVALNKAWREANKERKVALNKAWYEANKERKSETGKAWRESLSTSYVAGLLRLKPAECPPELIKIKREQIAITRLVKQLNEAIKEKTNAK